jgi:hypothetical protein
MHVGILGSGLMGGQLALRARVVRRILCFFRVPVVWSRIGR